MHDELRQIAIFAKTIECGSFRGAAAELQLSPSVISHHIAQLEDKLGVALIYRSTRRLTLTSDGEKLLNSAHTMLDAVESGLNELRGHSEEPSGTLRVTMSSALSQSRLIDDIAAFSMRYPKILLRLDFTDERRSLVNDGYDLAIRTGLNRSRAANRQSMFKGKRRLVAAQSYLATHGPIERPEDLKDQQWIILAPAQGIKPELKKPGRPNFQIVPDIQISVNDAYALYRFARAGVGVAIVPEFLAADDIASGVVRVLCPDWELVSLETYAEWPANAPKGGITKLLVSELCDPQPPRRAS